MKVCMCSLVHWWLYLIAGLACGWITELDCWTGLMDIFSHPHGLQPIRYAEFNWLM